MAGLVYFIDDESDLRLAAEQSFDLAGIACRTFSDAQDALSAVTRNFEGVIVSDIRMPNMDGTELLRRVIDIDQNIPVVLVTGHGDIELAVQSIKDGAYDFLEKPCEPALLVATTERALDRRRLSLENRALRSQVAPSHLIEDRLYGRSVAMTELRQRLGAVAATDADVLIVGETGTGKEVAARALHGASERAERPFVHINCAALPEALIESELFGSEAGAFPGAVRARVGRFEHARRGTLCLDEIDTLSSPLQAKLLHVLDARQVTRLGSNEAIPLDVRVIALSKTDLTEAASKGVFRADLLYRLNVVTLSMPPVTQRREDIPGLFTKLAVQAAERTGVEVPEIPLALLTKMAAQNWPGNVREIRNAAERFVLGLTQIDSEVGAKTLADHMANHEKALIAATIQANGGRLKETYEALGLSRKTLYDKMQRHGLTRTNGSDDP